MAKFREITGHYLVYREIPFKEILNIDYIESIRESKDNPNITHLNLANKDTFVVGHSVVEVLKIIGS